MTVPKWFLSRVGERCGSCGTRVPAASPMRRLQTGRARCAACAKKFFDETPPAALALVGTFPTVAPARTEARPLQPFVERARARLLPDVKRRASGDE